MTPPKIEYFQDHDGEWARLYVNGELERDGHSVDVWHLLVALRELGVIEVTDYAREGNVLNKNGEHLDVIHAPNWLQEFCDEFPVDESYDD